MLVFVVGCALCFHIKSIGKSCVKDILKDLEKMSKAMLSNLQGCARKVTKIMTRGRSRPVLLYMQIDPVKRFFKGFCSKWC